MKKKLYGQLTIEEFELYKAKVKSLLEEDFSPLIDDGIIKDIHGSKPEYKLHEEVKEAYEGMKKRLIDRGVYYGFSGNISKLETLITMKRKNLDKPLSVVINGAEVLLSLTPFLLLQNDSGEEVNEKLDELIELEKFKLN